MSLQDFNPAPAVLREDVGKHKFAVAKWGALAVAFILFGLLQILLGPPHGPWIGLVLLAALPVLAMTSSLKRVRQCKRFEVGPEGVAFWEFIDDKLVVRRIAWSDIGYFQVLSDETGMSAIYWASTDMPPLESFDQPIYDLQFPERCAIGRWPIVRGELAALLNSAHLRWRKEPA